MILVPVKESLSFGRVSDFTITNIWFYSSAFFLL